MRVAGFTFLFLFVFFCAGSAMAAKDPVRAQEEFDNAMTACMTEFFKNDTEAAAGIYDGEGFAWTEERDRTVDRCLRGSGFRMPFDKNQRIGVPGMVDPNPMSKEEILRHFREGMLAYGGPKQLAEIDAYTAAMKARLAEERGEKSPEATDKDRKPEPAKPSATKPPEDKRKKVYVPSKREDDVPKPIWLNIR